MRPSRRSIAVAIVAVAALATAAWAFWPESTKTTRFETGTQEHSFGFGTKGRFEKQLKLELPIKPEDVRGADDVRGAVRISYYESEHYPGGGSGEFRCSLKFFLDGHEWHKKGFSAGIKASSAADWGGEPDRTKSLSSSQLMPSFEESKITHLVNERSRVLGINADCENLVATEGPATVRFVLGPLFALVER